VGDSKSLERALRRSERQASTFAGRMTARLGRTGIAAGAALGAGLVAGVQQSIKQAMEAQKVLGQTRVAVRNTGLEWRDYSARIQESTTALSRLAGITDEELMQAFSLLVRGTKDVNRALTLTADAANLARARNMDVVAAAQLLVRVNAGQVGSLRRLGIQVDKNATGLQALAQVHRQYADAARTFGLSAAGAQERFRIAVDELEEAVGLRLLPTITTYLTQASKWLENTKNQKTAAETTATAVDTLAASLQGLAAAMAAVARVQEARKGLKEALGPFGFVLAGPFETVKLWKKNMEEMRKLLGLPGPPEPAKAPRWAAAYTAIEAARAAGAGAGAAAGRPRIPAIVSGTKQLPRGPSVELRNRWFDAMVARMTDRVQDIRTLRGQIGRLREIAGLIQDRIAATRDVTRRLSLEDQVAGVMREIRARQEQIAQEARAAADANKERQEAVRDELQGWLELNVEKAGLTDTVRDDLKALRVLLKVIQERIRLHGKTLDLAREELDVKKRIRDTLKQSEGVTQYRLPSAVKLTAGLGLTPAEMARFRLNLRGLTPSAGAAGAGGFTIHNRLDLDGRQVAVSTRKYTVKSQQRTPSQTRGRQVK
jgi:hypothetical protein